MRSPKNFWKSVEPASPDNRKKRHLAHKDDNISIQGFIFSLRHVGIKIASEYNGNRKKNKGVEQ
jgi:hypothetical protein